MALIGSQPPQLAAEIDNPLVIYGGQVFRISKVTLWECRPVYAEDGTDRIYLHHRIGVQAVWNPAATRSGDGVSPWVSLSDVKEQTLRPRQQLTITSGVATILESPLPSPFGGHYECDARNGPNPLALNILKVMGTQSVLAYFEIETWIPNDCPNNRLSVLSHRFSQRETINSNFWTTRSTTGQATFRRDLLQETNRLPDDFRARLFHPLSRFYKRENVEVWIDSAGCSLSYRFDDVQQPVGMVDGPLTWAPTIKGTWKIGYHNTDIDILKAVTGLVAYRYVNVSIQVWGRPFAPKIELMRLCMKAAAGFGFFNDRLVKGFHKFDMAVSLDEPHVQLDGGVVLSGTLGQLASFADAGDELNDFVTTVINGEQSTFPVGIPGVTGDPRNFNPARSSGGRNGDRGRPGLYKLVHAAIIEPCDTPTPPNNIQGINADVGEYPNEVARNSTF